MTESNDQLTATLKAHKQSMTRSRQLLFEILRGSEPQTMQQIVERCRGRIDRASVYRTITLYESLGIVQRLQIGWKYKLELSNDFQEHHHHANCTVCHQSFALPENDRLEKNLQLLAVSAGFTMQSHQLELRGICRDCIKKPGFNPV